jgi:hypothetical protein
MLQPSSAARRSRRWASLRRSIVMKDSIQEMRGEIQKLLRLQR